MKFDELMDAIIEVKSDVSDVNTDLGNKFEKLMDITNNNYERIEEVKVIAEGNALGIADLRNLFREG